MSKSYGGIVDKVKAYKVLTAEEEKRLFSLIKEGVEPEASKARERIINAHLRLAYSHAHRRLASPAYRNILFDDLFQEAAAALCVAVDKFDTEAGARFSTYSTFWIRCALDDYLNDNRTLFRIPSTGTVKRVMAYYYRSKSQLTEKNPHLSLEQLWVLIAADLNVPVTAVRAIGRVHEYHVTYLDQPIKGLGGESITVGDSLVDEEADPFGDLERSMDFERLMRELGVGVSKLSPRERDIYKSRTLRYDDDKLTLDALGERYGITKERVRQLEVKLVDKLGAHIKKNIDDIENRL